MAAAGYARARSLRKFDWWLAVSALILLGLGLATMYSVSLAPRYQGQFSAHLIRVAIGVLPLTLFLLAPPRLWQRSAVGLYVLNLGLLIGVRLVGTRGGGAQRWIELGGIEFQPSEVSKILLALTLASFFASRMDKIDRFSTFALSFLHLLIPASLVFMQPHLGAAIVLVVIWLSISIVAGVPLKFILAPIVLVIALFAIGFAVPGVLKDYQKERLTSLWSGDTQGSSFQVSRAELAFGSGGLGGTGYLKGEQKMAGIIPDQRTDFIFTVVGEEGGFIGAGIVVAAFGFFFFRGWLVMYRSIDPFSKLAAAGIIGALAFHAVANLFMNVQLMPVVGLWLPFFSYGGTAMWMCMASVGLLLSLRRHERPLLF